MEVSAEPSTTSESPAHLVSRDGGEHAPAGSTDDDTPAGSTDDDTPATTAPAGGAPAATAAARTAPGGDAPAGTTAARTAPGGDAPAGSASSHVVRAAGGIVVRASVIGGWEVAVIHRPLQRDWSLPKGKVEPGESAEECALREVQEETGWSCVLGRFVGEVEYVDRRGRPKVVGYWLMQPIEGEWHASDEVDALAWVPLAEAPSRLSYGHDRDLLTAVAGASGVAGHS
jgi:8-oxo-dGTP diphosphatase